MTTKEIVDLLRFRETEYIKTKTFSKLPGIYALFFIGDNFPILGDSVSKHQIIYIGKTESSQEKRDAKTHFTTGKTGSSTVRKSIGSLLCENENLKPIPRNETDYEKKRFSHFKFDNKSEIKITKWMENNLALSFYEYPRTKQEIEDLETKLIDELVPILNISKNSKNSFRDTLQNLRKNCALNAAKDFNPNRISNQQNITTQQKNISNMAPSGKYTDLWSKQRALIQVKLNNATTKQSIQLNSEDFNKVGNRSNYSFNLEFLNGIVSNNIDGSAVARDLAKVIEDSKEIREILKMGHFKFNMDRQFCLWIEKR
ncbi:MAG: hypothetical protein BGO29_01790 [Bacteroidales bacterium 36-12]|jgi:hypothetical protein|nr:MAG: hypothetical protein BGO29_01790 [Bacteroidales bacterium 36-12]